MNRTVAHARQRLRATAPHAGTIAVTLFAFALSRVAYWKLGVRFDANSIGWYLQYLDPDLLRHDLWRSVFYLHSQPPLFNLFLGAVLQAFPERWALAFNVLYLAMGVLQTVLLTVILRRVGVRRWLTVLLVVAFTCAPSTVVYENWLFYAYVTTTLLIVGLYCLVRFLGSRRTMHATAFVAMAAVVLLTRSTYNLVWLLIAVALVALNAGLRRALVAASLPLAVVAAVTAKNAVVFHVITPGDVYASYNLALMATDGLPRGVVDDAIRGGELPPVYAVPLTPLPPPPAAYAGRVPRRDPRGVRALDDARKPSGWLNFNHAIYLDVGRELARGLPWLLRAHRESYEDHVRRNARAFFLPCLQTWPFDNDPNARAVARVEQLFERVLGRSGTASDAVCLWLLLPALLAFGLASSVRALRRRARRTFALYAFLSLTILAVTPMILVSYGDQCRYRDETDAYFVVLAGLLVETCLRAARSFVTRAPRRPRLV